MHNVGWTMAAMIARATKDDMEQHAIAEARRFAERQGRMKQVLASALVAIALIGCSSSDGGSDQPNSPEQPNSSEQSDGHEQSDDATNELPSIEEVKDLMFETADEFGYVPNIDLLDESAQATLELCDTELTDDLSYKVIWTTNNLIDAQKALHLRVCPWRAADLGLE